MEYTNIFEIAATAVLGAIGWVGKLMYTRMENMRTALHDVRNQIHEFKFEIAQNYVPKQEFREAITGLKDDIHEVKDDLKDDLRLIMEMLQEKENK